MTRQKSAHLKGGVVVKVVLLPGTMNCRVMSGFYREKTAMLVRNNDKAMRSILSLKHTIYKNNKGPTTKQTGKRNDHDIPVGNKHELEIIYWSDLQKPTASCAKREKYKGKTVVTKQVTMKIIQINKHQIIKEHKKKFTATMPCSIFIYTFFFFTTTECYAIAPNDRI